MRFNQLYDLHLLNPYRFWISEKCDKKYRNVRSSNVSIFQLQPIVNFGWYRTGVYFSENGFDSFSLHEHKYLFNWDLKIKDGGEHLDYDRRHIIYIHTSLSICWSPKIEFSIGGNRFSFWPRSNKEITHDSVIEMVLNYINNVVYYPENTNYGAIQRLHCVKKADLVIFLKSNKRKDCYHVDSMRAIKRKFGYFTNEWHDTGDFVKLASKLFKERGKGKNEEISIFKFEFPQDFDGDIDELEDVFNEQYEDQLLKNTILV